MKNIIDETVMHEVTKRLVEVYSPEVIYLFGSYAWGTPDSESDLDLLIVVDSLDKDRFQIIAEGHRALYDLGIFKDILVYNKEEFKQCSSQELSLCGRIAREGKIIYAKA